MATRFHLRPATEADIPAILALVEASVRGLQQHDYTPAQIEASLGSAFGVDHQLIADRTYFLAIPADQPGMLAACGGWSFRRTLCGSDALSTSCGPGARDSSPLDPADPAAFAKIRAIFVHPSWARQGLGSLLLAHCESAARAAGFRRFEMGSTLTGVPLYTLRGYVETGRSQLPLPHGESLSIVTMQKSDTNAEAADYAPASRASASGSSV